MEPVSYTHLRAHETTLHLVCRLLLEKKKTEEETNDDFENLYKGQVSKSGVAILPSKRTRRIPEVKKPSLADEALSELKAEQPEIKEENLDTEEAPLELSEEAPAEENKPE